MFYRVAPLCKKCKTSKSGGTTIPNEPIQRGCSIKPVIVNMDQSRINDVTTALTRQLNQIGLTKKISLSNRSMRCRTKSNAPRSKSQMTTAIEQEINPWTPIRESNWSRSRSISACDVSTYPAPVWEHWFLYHKLLHNNWYISELPLGDVGYVLLYNNIKSQ